MQPFEQDVRSDQSPTVLSYPRPQSQQPLPANFEGLFANPASTNLPRYGSHPIEWNQTHGEPWFPDSYPLSTTDFASLPDQLSPPAPFYPPDSFISHPPILRSQHSEPTPDSNSTWHHYDPRTNQFHPDVETVFDHNRSLAKRLSPRQLRRYCPNPSV